LECGGFKLAKSPAEITLMDVYEAIEGTYHPSDCLLGRPVCDGRECVLGGLVESVNGQVRAYLSGTTLAQLARPVDPRNEE
jgi:DNA-binding IscR family transcriptional regulator